MRLPADTAHLCTDSASSRCDTLRLHIPSDFPTDGLFRFDPCRATGNFLRLNPSYH